MILLRRPAARLRRASRGTRGQRGFGSLIEVLVALLMILTVLAAAGLLFTQSATARRNAEATDRATQLANDRIEYIRSLAWQQIGFYSDDNPTPTFTVRPGVVEHPVIIGAARPSSGALAPKPNESSVSVGANRFDVHTDITWATALNPSTGTPPVDAWNNTVGHNPQAGADAPDGIPDYAAKRITVTVTWEASDGQIKKVVDTSLRSPTLTEVIPSMLRAPAAQACDSSIAPLCEAWASSGRLLKISSGTVVTDIEILLKVTTNGTASGVTAAVANGPTVTLTADPGSGGTKWTGSIASGATVRPGAQRITFTVTGGASAGNAVYTGATWTVPSAAAGDIRAVGGSGPTVWTDGAIRVVAAKAPGDTTPITGNETPTAAYFCVDSSRRLANYQAVLFDVTNIDDQDNPGLKPTVTYTGADTDPASPASTGTVSPDHIGHPSASQPASGPYAAYSGVTGYEGPYNPGWGALNTPRWAAGFDRGTILMGSHVAITMSITRPLDGVTLQRTVTVPVQVGVNCTNPSIAAPDLRLSYNASNTLIASWTNQAATTYDLQYTTDPNVAADPNGAWVTVANGTTSPYTLSGGFRPPAGQTYYYRARAHVGANYSDWSAVRGISG